MDHIGPIARSARDAALLLTAVAGPDDLDPTTLSEPMPDLAGGPAAGSMRIGVDLKWNTDVDDAVATTLAHATETLRDLGAEIVEVQAPDCDQAIADWTALCSVEASVAHEATFPARRAEYGPVLASVLDAGAGVSAADLHRIELRRLALRGRFDRLLAGVDLLLTPVHPFAPLTLDDIRTLGDQPELIARLQRYTAPFDLTGGPTITLPGRPTDAGLPVGIQLVAGHRREDALVAAATAFQDATGSHRRHPLP